MTEEVLWDETGESKKRTYQKKNRDISMCWRPSLSPEVIDYIDARSRENLARFYRDEIKKLVGGEKQYNLTTTERANLVDHGIIIRTRYKGTYQLTEEAKAILNIR